MPDNPIAAQIAELPTGPGCYLFRDREGTLLYIGKAVNLRSRVRSYFGDTVASPKVRVLAMRVAAIEHVSTRNEIEALALENNLIKRHQPFYNIRLRDDSTYPFLKLTTYETYPRLLVVRRRLPDGAKYFGPFPDAGAMRATMHLVGRLFPLRKKRTPPFKNRPCLNYDIGRCLAPCQELISRADYDRMVDGITQFLEGRHRDLLTRLQADMTAAAESLDFERAAKLRDLVRSVERVMERQLVVGETEDDCDALAVAIGPGFGCIELFQVREGKVVSRREHTLELPREVVETAEDLAATIIGAFIGQHYGDAEIPPEILVPALPDFAEALEAYLGEKRGSRVHLTLPQRGSRRKLLDLVQENANAGAERLALSRSAAQERTGQALSALAEAIGMEDLPERIEGFDISHVQGTDPVASLVVFCGAQPAKAEYRKFKIRTAKGGDDFASMQEVVQRRYAKLLREGADMPDLILIDGGRGQLNAALEALRALGVEEQPIFGLAKKLEELYLPARADPVRLPPGSPALHLIQRVRDEAHRFAVGFHRTLRGKHMSASALDGIPGVGPNRKRSLLSRLGSVEAMRRLDPADLAARGGIPRPVAERIHAALNSDAPE
ncbi:MAG: excinuclease ABC subunit UvrC [Candidatus Sericytochromatia bacterium]|nr:excinuclease ABC subunit UvrC [Candidatus Tanganyikabacteria bacterium]